MSFETFIEYASKPENGSPLVTFGCWAMSLMVFGLSVSKIGEVLERIATALEALAGMP